MQLPAKKERFGRRDVITERGISHFRGMDRNTLVRYPYAYISAKLLHLFSGFELAGYDATIFDPAAFTANSGTLRNIAF